ncbi:hypothetical protein XENORESO_008711 [Xenotaenia resolanae]|uniref:LRAT domain-containing protein n=1 Tax=Xenotaenia resolanae TaxID=208358 RepID=A0ABV0WJN0_9TELE
MIEIIRSEFYSHWAVYIGNGYIVHFVTEAVNSGFSTVPSENGSVRKELLTDVLNDCNWRVNNYLDKKYTPRPRDTIVKKACSLVGSSLTYSLTDYNCEHFATEQRYDIAVSMQVEKAKVGVAAGGTAVLTGFIAAASVMNKTISH